MSQGKIVDNIIYLRENSTKPEALTKYILRKRGDGMSANSDTTMKKQ